MSIYWLYCLRDGEISRAIPIEAADDIEAVELARLRLERIDCELWCGSRMVANVAANGAATFANVARVTA